MEKDIDYEQLYYDAMYENRRLKDKITELKNEIQDLNICRTKRNIDLQQYIMLQIKRKNKGGNVNGRNKDLGRSN